MTLEWKHVITTLTSAIELILTMELSSEFSAANCSLGWT